MWPKDITTWIVDRVGFASIPFTWCLPKAQRIIDQRDFRIDRWVVGGPAVKLLPDYLRGAEIGDRYPGVLQIVNSRATRTTEGCVRDCSFCGVKKVYPRFRELGDWPNNPILCDDNLLAASVGHFDRVIERLVGLREADFNQGIDARLLTEHHAKQIARIKKPKVRLALDDDNGRERWKESIGILVSCGVYRSHITSYVLIGFGGSVANDWDRCEFVRSNKIKPMPMWFHPLDAMEKYPISDSQRKNGWDHENRVAIMRYYYKHNGRVGPV